MDIFGLYKNRTSTIVKFFETPKEAILNILHLTVVSKFLPEQITYPAGWIPSTSLDKIIAFNLIRGKTLEQAREIFPEISIELIDK